MKRSLIAIIFALGLASVSFGAHAGGLFGDTDNSCKGNNNCNTTDNSVTNKAKASASARASSSSKSSSYAKGGSAYAKGGSAGAISGGNKLEGGDISIGGDKVDAAPAQAGAIGLNVSYECGGTAGAYASGPGLSVGGGTAFAFETCEDVFVARVGVEYGIEGAGAFLKAIVDRRAADFAARRASAVAPTEGLTRD